MSGDEDSFCESSAFLSLSVVSKNGFEAVYSTQNGAGPNHFEVLSFIKRSPMLHSLRSDGTFGKYSRQKKALIAESPSLISQNRACSRASNTSVESLVIEKFQKVASAIQEVCVACMVESISLIVQSCARHSRSSAKCRSGDHLRTQCPLQDKKY